VLPIIATRSRRAGHILRGSLLKVNTKQADVDKRHWLKFRKVNRTPMTT